MDNLVTVKGVTQIKINDRNNPETINIVESFKNEKLISTIPEPSIKYKIIGKEYKFCLNEFSEC